MSGSLAGLIPYIAYIGLAFLASKFGLIPERLAKRLSNLAFQVAIPLMLFYTIATRDLPSEIPWALWGAYLGGTCGFMFVFGWILKAFMNTNRHEAASLSISAAFSNSVMLGIPFHLNLLGEQAQLPVYALISLHATCLLISATLIASTGGGQGLGKQVKNVLWEMIKNPIVMSLLAGIAWSSLGLPLPPFAEVPLSWAALIAPPLALFTLGSVLARMDVQGSSLAIALVLVAKLLIHPLLIALIVFTLFDLSPLEQQVCILTACLPTGLNAFLFAKSVNAGEDVAAAAKVLGTPIGIASYFFVAWLLLG